MRQTTQCGTCKKWFVYDDERQVSCTVRHQRGECCHYGQQEFTPPQGRDSGCRNE